MRNALDLYRVRKEARGSERWRLPLELLAVSLRRGSERERHPRRSLDPRFVRDRKFGQEEEKEEESCPANQNESSTIRTPEKCCYESNKEGAVQNLISLVFLLEAVFIFC